MSYYLAKFHTKAKSRQDTSEKLMIEGIGVANAKERADQAAQRAGGGKAVLQLFNEIGLVATRTGDGIWST